MKKRILPAISLVVLISMMLVVSIPPAKAQFVLASWAFPDEYGQGIELFQIYENSTGSWVQVGENYGYADSVIFDLEIGIGVKIRCWAVMNYTLTNASTTDIGKKYIRHNITVKNGSGATIFSQQNFTFGAAVIEGPIYNYAYDVILGFLPEEGQYYAATVVCEVFY